MSNRWWIRWLVAVPLLAGGYYAYTSFGGTDTAGITFLEELITRGDIESTVSTSGAVKAKGTVEVGSELSGLIAEVLVDFNDAVQKDQVLARINPRTYETRLAQARAELQIAEADLRQAEQNLNKVRATLDLRRLQHRREKELHDKGYSNDSTLDEAKVNVSIAEADVAVADVQIGNRRATIEQRRAMLNNAEIELAKTFIRSPVDGIVLSRKVEVGQTVAASLQAPVLFTIAEDLQELEIEASVDESDIGKVAVNQPARFSVDAYPEREFDGVVKQVRLGALVNANVVTYTVIITARNDSQALMPGMTANLAILLGYERGVLKLPNQTLTFRPPAGYGGTETEANNQSGGQSRSGGGGPPGGFPGGGGGRPPWMNNSGGDAQGQRGSASGGSSPPAIRMLRELELADDQREKVREQMQALFQNGGPPEPRAMAQRLRGVLTKEQQAKLESLIAAEESGRQPESRTATIWVRDGRNDLKSVEVQIGISDSEYTHLLDGAVGEGDLVVVRVERKSS